MCIMRYYKLNLNVPHVACIDGKLRFEKSFMYKAAGG